MTVTTIWAARAADAAAVALTAATDELCRLDSNAGDGDHGFAMAAAAKAIRADVSNGTATDATSVVIGAAAHFASVGGSMGALLSVALESLAEVVVDPVEQLTSTQVVQYFAVVEESLTDFGGAARGDKTIVDAVAAAHAAAVAAAAAGAGAHETLAAAAAGAREGADATADMVARIGRASRLGERSRGYVDPGAQSFAIVIDALARTPSEGESA